MKCSNLAGKPEFNPATLRLVQAMVLLAMLLQVVGCANQRSIYRSTSPADDFHLVTVDAKQRFLITATETDSNGRETLQRFCAEPSPDTFSAFAASLSAEGRTKAFEGALQSAFSENAASLGLRTQAIQLLRDGMYRACEGAINGDIRDRDFVDLHRRYQRIMVTLVAIEQLTGAVHPPAVAIQTSALAERPAMINAVQDALQDARSRVIELEKSHQSEGETTFERTAGNGSEDVECNAINDSERTNPPEACREFLVAEKNLAEAKENVKALEQELKSVRSDIINRASGTVTLTHAAPRQVPLDPASVQVISDTVREMVSSMFNLDPDAAIVAFQKLECPIVFRLSDNLRQAERNLQLAEAGTVGPGDVEKRAAIQTAQDAKNLAVRRAIMFFQKRDSIAAPFEAADPELTANQVHRERGVCEALTISINSGVLRPSN